MEKKENLTPAFGDDISIAQDQPGIFKCFRILMEYIFVIIFIHSLVIFIFPSFMSAIQPGASFTSVANMSNLLALFSGLIASGYFTFLVTRKYFPAPTINLSLRRIGLLPCSKVSALTAVTIGITWAVIFENVLSSRYPANPIAVGSIRSQFGEASVWIKIFLMIITVCIAPIVEEIFFRGFLYKILSKTAGKVTAALIVTTIFVLLHYHVFSYWVAFLSLLTGSIALIVIREISASLIPGILIHQFYNLGVIVFQS